MLFYFVLKTPWEQVLLSPFYKWSSGSSEVKPSAPCQTSGSSRLRRWSLSYQGLGFLTLLHTASCKGGMVREVWRKPGAWWYGPQEERRWRSHQQCEMHETEKGLRGQWPWIECSVRVTDAGTASCWELFVVGTVGTTAFLYHLPKLCFHWMRTR